MKLKGAFGMSICGLALAGSLWFAHAKQLPIDDSNLHSVKALTKKLDAIKSKNDDEETDYLDALRERIYIKAFPNDTPNEDQYLEASARARLMPPAHFGPDKPSAIRASGIITVGPEVKWEFVGPQALSVPYNIYYGPPGSNINGRVGDLAFDPNVSSTMYMAAPAGGIWKTVDSGATWKSIGDHFPSPYVCVIAVHPHYPNIIIAGLGDKDGGTGSSNGIMRSEDGGASWVNIVLRSGVNCSKVLYDPDNFDTVTVSTAGGSGGLFRSTNQGYSFTSVSVGGSSFPNVTDMSFSQADGSGNRYYAAQVRNQGLYLSTDRGLTWTLSNEPAGALTSGRTHIDFSHVTSNRLYYLNDGLRQIYQGDISGTVITWTNITGNFPMGITGNLNYNWSQSWYDDYLRVAAHTVSGVKKDFLYVGLITIASWDGTNWTDIGQTYQSTAKTHNDQHSMAVFPGDETKLAAGNDGGVWPLAYTPPAGASPQAWNFGISSSATLGISMFYSGAFHPTDPTRMMGGTQDNATPVSTGNLSAWVNRTGGDGMGCAINPVNPLVWYGAAQYNGLYRTTNGWTTQISFGPNSWGTDTLPFVTRMAVDPTSPNPLYVATNYLWRWNTSTGIWDSRLGGINLCPSGGTVLSIAIAPSNANNLYAGTTNGDVWRSADKGATWTKLDDISSPVIPARSVTCISVSPTNPNDILITLSGSGTAHIWRIADTSLPTPILTAVNGSGAGTLPDTPVNWVTRDDVAPATTWYAATDVGVMMTTNGGSSWSNATEPLGLPVCEVSKVEWVPGTGYLNAATYGRGMWRLRVKDPAPITDTTLIFKPTSARFEDEYTVKYQVTNAGLGTANRIQITAATLKMKQGSTTIVTPLPLNVGQLNPTLSTFTSILWKGPNASDSSGTVTINGTYVVGGVTHAFSQSNTVLFP